METVFTLTLPLLDFNSHAMWCASDHSTEAIAFASSHHVNPGVLMDASKVGHRAEDKPLQEIRVVLVWFKEPKTP